MTDSINTDISREGLTMGKVVELFKLIFNTKATQVLDSKKLFSLIDFDALHAKGYTGLILDVDDCIAPHHGEILPENIEVIKTLRQKEWQIVVFSNMVKSPRYTPLEALGIKIITSIYAKPDKRGFQECLQALGLASDKVIGVGDNFLTDGGCREAGIAFIKITPLRTDTHRSMSRRVQIAIQDMIDKIAKVRGHIQ